MSVRTTVKSIQDIMRQDVGAARRALTAALEELAQIDPRARKICRELAVPPPSR